MLAAPLVRRTTAVALLLVVALAGSACTGPRPTLADAVEPLTSSTTTSSTVPPAPVEVAEANGDAIDVFFDAASADPVRQLTAAEATSTPGHPIVFLVKGRANDRLEVYLPVRPIGSTGWVRAADVAVSTVAHRIEVALGAHRLRVLDGARVVIDEPVGVGRVDVPTPGATYFVRELVELPDPEGPYGPYAYALNGFTTDPASFDSGAGLVGIHGTDAPKSIGKDVATGCLSLQNAVVKRLVEKVELPLGTPVTIVD